MGLELCHPPNLQHSQHLVLRTKNTASGPDGVPNAAWSHCGPVPPVALNNLCMEQLSGSEPNPDYYNSL